MTVSPINRRSPRSPSENEDKYPKNIEAEKTILGAIVLDNAVIKTVRAILQPDDFFMREHRIIFRNMLFLADTEQPIELIPLVDNLERNRELDGAGGAAYISGLGDGLPKNCNVGFYAKLVKEKSMLCELIRAANLIEQEAFGSDERTESIVANAAALIAKIQRPSKENPAVVVCGRELLTLELPKADPLIDPLVTRAGTFMLYSWAGVGKSWVASEIATRIAGGIDTIFNGHQGPGGHWPIYGPVPTLYLYGEMHGERIRQRLIDIAKGNGLDGVPEALGVMSKDYQRIPRAPKCSHGWRPSVHNASDRQFIEERLFGEGFGFLVLDNISTLWSAAQEEQSHQVAVLKDWFIDLNTRGITVLFLQHAGKGGDFLGDSAQIHIVDSVVKLTHPPDYRKREGLRIIVEIEKQREFGNPSWAGPFEAQLSVTPENGVQWVTRTALAVQKKSAFAMFNNGAPPTEVLKSLPGVFRSTVYRWHKEFKDNRNSDPNDDDE